MTDCEKYIIIYSGVANRNARISKMEKPLKIHAVSKKGERFMRKIKGLFAGFSKKGNKKDNQ